MHYTTDFNLLLKARSFPPVNILQMHEQHLQKPFAFHFYYDLKEDECFKHHSGVNGDFQRGLSFSFSLQKRCLDLQGRTELNRIIGLEWTLESSNPTFCPWQETLYHPRQMAV